MHQGNESEHVPLRWREYRCVEYFRDRWAERGHLDEASQTLVVVTELDAYEEPEIGFFAIGRSGGDGIDFGYRKDLEGLWAYYPIEGRFKFMSETVAKLVDGWCSGRLSV